MEFLAGRASPHARIQLLSAGMTADGARIYRVKDRPTVLKVSPPEFPTVISEMTQKARLARETLGAEIGRPIPVPLDEWERNGVSCALFEELSPISNHRVIRRIQLRRLTPLVLNWLRKVAALERGVSGNAERNLEALADCPCGVLRALAKDELTKIRAESFLLRSRVMHGDFWVGNILLDPSGVRDFVIIDWRGSNIDGFPIFDLVKFAESAKLAPRLLRRELTAHAKILGCTLEQTRTYLLAALGDIWMNLDQFPPERFAEMAELNLRSLDVALNG